MDEERGPARAAPVPLIAVGRPSHAVNTQLAAPRTRRRACRRGCFDSRHGWMESNVMAAIAGLDEF